MEYHTTNDQIDGRIIFIKAIGKLGSVCPCPGAIYKYVHEYGNYFQTFFSKAAWPVKANFMWNIHSNAA